MKVVKSTKSVMGFEPFIGSEWDAGYVPFACSHRAVRVTVRKDADGLWTVYALGRKGDKVLAKHDLAVFNCETCAKAFALCLVFGTDYAECEIHHHDAFSDADLFDATVKVLLAVMGIDASAWDALDEGARHRVLWTVRELLDSKISWTKVIALWEATENKPIGVAVRAWWSLLDYNQGGR